MQRTGCECRCRATAAVASRRRRLTAPEQALDAGVDAVRRAGAGAALAAAAPASGADEGCEPVDCPDRRQRHGASGCARKRRPPPAPSANAASKPRQQRKAAVLRRKRRRIDGSGATAGAEAGVGWRRIGRSRSTAEQPLPTRTARFAEVGSGWTLLMLSAAVSRGAWLAAWAALPRCGWPPGEPAALVLRASVAAGRWPAADRPAA